MYQSIRLRILRIVPNQLHLVLLIYKQNQKKITKLNSAFDAHCVTTENNILHIAT